MRFFVSDFNIQNLYRMREDEHETLKKIQHVDKENGN